MSVLNLSTLRHHTARHPAQDAGPERGLLHTPITRRAVLGATAVLSTSSSTLADLLQRAVDTIQFRSDGTSAWFNVHGVPSWIIDPSRFGGRPRLSVHETAKSIAIDLRGALFPGTALPADLQCRVEKGRLGWTIRVAFALGKFNAFGDLASWLRGEQPLQSAVVPLGMLTSGIARAASLRIDSRAVASFHPSWQFIFKAIRGTLSLEGTELDCGHMTIGLPSRDQRSLAADPSEKWTRFSVSRGSSGWPAIIPSRVLRGSLLEFGTNALDTVTLETHDRFDGVRTYFAAASRRQAEVGTLRVWPNDASRERSLFVLPLRDLAYAGADGAGAYERAIVAGQASSVWLDTGTARLELGDDESASVVEIVESNGEPSRHQIAPRLVASLTPIEGAIAIPAQPARPTRLRLAAHHGGEAAADLCPGCRVEFDENNLEDRPPCHIISVLRPRDLLVVRFELINLHIRKKWLHEPRLERADIHAPAFLIVHLPPQHIAERAFFEATKDTETPSIECMESRLACESRLVFRLKQEVDRIPYDIASLLNWDPSIFEPVKVPPTRNEKDIEPPKRLQTDIEFPWRLHLSPDDGCSWLHAAKPVTIDDRTELWHTRMMLDRPWEAPYPTVRAVWNDGSTLPPSKCPGKASPKLPFRTSLDDEDRHNIVLATHDTNRDPKPVDAHLFLLSALGAWSDLRGEWLCTPKRACNALERWTHLASMGRDQKVVIEERAFCMRTGHKVNLITETTREFIPVPILIDGRERRMFVAFLIQRLYVKVKEPRVLTYENWDMHHRSIEIVDERTPFLDEPVDEASGSIPKSSGSGVWGDRAFWPTVGGEVFRFRLRGVDYAGNVEEWLEPMLVVKQVCESSPDELAGFANSPHLADAIAAYNSSPRRVVPFDGRAIALATSLRKGDTEVTVQDATYEVLHVRNVPANPCAIGYLAPDSAALMLHKHPCEPPFWPVTKSLRGSVPAIETFLGSSRAAKWLPVALTCDDAFETFVALETVGSTEAGFHGQSDRSGGAIAPSPDISHLSRRFGPVGLGAGGRRPLTDAQRASAAPLPAPAARADAADFFKADATILGTIRLQDIITAIDPANGSVPALQSLLTSFADGPDFLQQSLSWETTQVKEWSDLPIIAFEPKPGTTKFVINGSFSVIVGDALSAKFAMEGRLETFAVRIGLTSAGARVHFTGLRYTATSDGKTSFDVDIDRVEFLGILAFVQKLANLLKEFVKKELGVEIDLQEDGLNVWMPPINLDKVSFGIVTLKNLNIRSWVRLPFRPNPVELGFSFGRADAPCELQVGIYGGTAYVLVLLDSESGGIRRFEAAFEFGILREVSFGPAHGRVYLLGGVFYSASQSGNQRLVTLRAYVRAGGSVDVLGLITAYIDLYIGLRYESTGAQSFLVGEASLTIGFKIAIVSHSVTLRRAERIAGSQGGTQQSGFRQILESCQLAALGETEASCGSRMQRPAPRFIEAMPYESWRDYWEAFETTPEVPRGECA